MKRIPIIIFSLLSYTYALKAQNVYLNNSEYIYLKNSSNVATRAFGINSLNHLYFGSIDAAINNMYFSNNGVNLMTLLDNGNLGIGTTSPSTKLEVFQPIGSKSNFITVGAASYESMRIGVDAAGARIQSNSANQPIYFSLNGSERMRVTANGDVGIGTTSPSDKLEIIGNFVSRVSEGGNRLARIANSGNDGELHIYASNLSTVKIDGNGNSYLNGGNVGIGITSPDEKLEVNGTIRSKKVKVEAATWPDYVFSSDYKLRKLEDLEIFINKNQHLPEVPSAKEAEANGQDLGGIQAVLLKKIEELTLYVIEQDKRLKMIEEENSLLKVELEKLKK
ncbi:hypothetical protein [Roseivirga pacifica]|uniref:hypothetical protein n=1 Tax=Roseivirga pacifica TaxID=1267423 RepID=UPI003BAB2DAC